MVISHTCCVGGGGGRVGCSSVQSAMARSVSTMARRSSAHNPARSARSSRALAFFVSPVRARGLELEDEGVEGGRERRPEAMQAPVHGRAKRCLLGDLVAARLALALREARGRLK